MLTNFILDADLIAQRGDIMSYLRTGQTTYSAKIALAFELTLNELKSRSIDPRRIHIPIDVNRDYDSVIKQDQLILLTKIASGNSEKYAVGLSGFRRLVINVSALSGTSFVPALQGSNDIITGEDLPVNWNTVTSLSFTTVGMKTITFTTEYKYYRLLWTLTGTSVSFATGLYETCFDQLIIQKTFQLIYQEWAKSIDEIWYDYMKIAEQNFETVMQSIKFVLDSNDDNLPAKEEDAESAEVRFTR